MIFNDTSANKGKQNQREEKSHCEGRNIPEKKKLSTHFYGRRVKMVFRCNPPRRDGFIVDVVGSFPTFLRLFPCNGHF